MSNDDIDYSTVGKFVGGGALTGAAISSLLQYIKSTKQLASNAAKDTSADDDVLYIKGKRKEQKKSASELDDIGFKGSSPEYSSGSGEQKFLNLVGGLAGGLGGYLGVRGLYTSIKKKQLQDELDSAQVAYMSQLTKKRDKERNKYASVKSADTGSRLSTGKAGLYSAMTLLALASGVISYRTLDKAFPRRGTGKDNTGKPISLAPEKIKVLGRRNKVVDTIDTDGKPDDTDKIEHLIRSASANDQLCKESGFDDLLAAIAQGRTQNIKANVEFGIDHVFNTVKGAAIVPISDEAKNMAVGVLARDPMLKEAFVPLLAAEYAHTSPSFFDAAVSMDSHEADLLEKVAAAFNKEYRQGNFPEQENLFTKDASALLAGFGAVADASEKLSEGTTFFSSGQDSENSDEATEEDAPETVEGDTVDGFFDKKLDDSTTKNNRK